MDERKTLLVAALRSKCLAKGCGGIKGLGVAFRKLDIDYSKRITYPELCKGVADYGVDFSKEELRLLFDTLDKDGSGGIDFSEFMFELRGPLVESRKDVIREAFEKMDVNKDGVLSVEDLRVIYTENAKCHPRYQSGEWTLEQTLRQFLDALDTPGYADGKVTWDEFLLFYSGVSATVQDDCYFDLLMRTCYGLPKRSSHPKS